MNAIEFDVIMDDIKYQPKQGSVQHFVIVDPEGEERLSFLKQIQIAIGAAPDLSERFVVITLDGGKKIGNLFDLLVEVLKQLNQSGIKVNMPASEKEATTDPRELFACVLDILTSIDKKLLLLLDNIEQLLGSIQDYGASLLREYLLNYSEIKIIGGCAELTEHFWDYDKPLYRFFRILELVRP